MMLTAIIYGKIIKVVNNLHFEANRDGKRKSIDGRSEYTDKNPCTVPDSR